MTRAQVADFCHAGMVGTGAEAMAVVLGTASGALHVLFATDDLAEQLAELECLHAEGPQHDAVVTSLAATATDLTGGVARHRWPTFASGAARAGVKTVHAYPIRLSDGTRGSVGFYARRVVVHTSAQHRLAQDVTELIGLALVDQDADAPVPVGLPMTVHQAAGMVMQQAGISVVEALIRLRWVAFTEDVRITDLAAEVIRGGRRFASTEVTHG